MPVFRNRLDNFKGVFILIGLLCLSGCGPVKEIPVKEVEKVVVRDSIITHTDTVTIEVPKETIREVLPEIDTSVLETSLAVSTAFLDTTARQIHHTLKNKPQTVKKPVEVAEKIVTVTKEIEKEVPVRVEVPRVPSWCWWLLVLNGVVIAFKVGRLIYKYHNLY